MVFQIGKSEHGQIQSESEISAHLLLDGASEIGLQSQKMQVLISSSELATWEGFINILDSKGLTRKRFDTIKQACEALTRDNVILIFCENRLMDGTYEDLLTAARNVRSEARIVVTGLMDSEFDSLGYCKARELGAYDVLRKSYGLKDLEWAVICAIRDEERVRTAASWRARVKPAGIKRSLKTRENPDTGSHGAARIPA